MILSYPVLTTSVSPAHARSSSQCSFVVTWVWSLLCWRYWDTATLSKNEPCGKRLSFPVQVFVFLPVKNWLPQFSTCICRSLHLGYLLHHDCPPFVGHSVPAGVPSVSSCRRLCTRASGLLGPLWVPLCLTHTSGDLPLLPLWTFPPPLFLRGNSAFLDSVSFLFWCSSSSSIFLRNGVGKYNFKISCVWKCLYLTLMGDLKTTGNSSLEIIYL